MVGSGFATDSGAIVQSTESSQNYRSQTNQTLPATRKTRYRKTAMIMSYSCQSSHVAYGVRCSWSKTKSTRFSPSDIQDHVKRGWTRAAERVDEGAENVNQIAMIEKVICSPIQQLARVPCLSESGTKGSRSPTSPSPSTHRYGQRMTKSPSFVGGGHYRRIQQHGRNLIMRRSQSCLDRQMSADVNASD